MNKNGEHRVVLSAKVSKKAAEGWKNFCAGNGISLSAMIEIAGLRLGEEHIPPRIPERVEMVRQARELDIARRSRSRE